MRANRTAANYNEYILKNSYVWQGNIPTDIRENLPLITGEEAEEPEVTTSLSLTCPACGSAWDSAFCGDCGTPMPTN